MERPQQKEAIGRDLDRKYVFLTGPRQVGKTTLARRLAEARKGSCYLNFDADPDRIVILRQAWDRKAPLIVLDEVHKLKSWKRRLKGVYDTEGIPPRVLVTGSARLDLYRRGGDSMAGRYFLHRLHPLSVRELRGTAPPAEILERLMRHGGFPEPYLSGNDQDAARWRQQHLERIVREDIQDLEPVKDVKTLLLLVDLLRERVGSPISHASLGRDLELSPHTVKRWIQVLEHMYVVFLVAPWHRNVARAILKEPKVYFYDTGAVRGDEGARLENAVAVCLRKWLHHRTDTQGRSNDLHYIRDKEKREVDFAIVEDRRPHLLIEVKRSDTSVSPSLRYFAKRLAPAESLQIVQAATRAQTLDGIHVRPAADWLDSLEA
ncbi:MAG: ATP-binding protein [Planctomycetes bacterium]|nr:ATP-binding protein [Planctomycetota bacterium]